jgi:hypothetical protein
VKDLGTADQDQAIADIIRALLDARTAEASICPSEVARQAAPPKVDWRELMPRVRAVAAALAHRGVLTITRGEEILHPDELWGGPIRLRRGKNWTKA